jgi:vacuolar iron transporter family protein
MFVAATSLIFLAVQGALAAHAGGAPLIPGTWRATFWGVLARAVTRGAGALFGAAA